MNKIFIKGRISNEIDVRFAQATNKKIARFSVAVRRDYKNQQGEYDTDFFNITTFGNTSEFVGKYFSKGQEIIIIGHLQNRSWETDTGEKRYATDIIAENVEFCGSKKQETFQEEVEQKSTINDFQSNDNMDLPF